MEFLMSFCFCLVYLSDGQRIKTCIVEPYTQTESLMSICLMMGIGLMARLTHHNTHYAAANTNRI